MSPDFWLNLALAIGTGAGLYAAIRVDLVTAKLRADQAAQDANKAHERIDSHINDHLRGINHDS